jgi:hypothetical protein
VGAAQEHQEDQWIEHGQGERNGLIAAHGAGQRGHPYGNQNDTDESHGAKPHECRENVVPCQMDDATRETFPRGSVGGACMTPEGIHQAEDPAGFRERWARGRTD